jgi:RimJ/RimL family protein N-acetyltransferase
MSEAFMLEGRVVGLRAIERSDLEPLRQWRNQPDFRRYFREYREISADMQLRWYETVVLGDSVRMFSIVERATGRLLGACGLCYLDLVNRSADFSIYLGADELYIDDVFAPDAAGPLLAYGFDELGLHRIWAEIYDFDHKKAEFFDRLGFRLDGRHRQAHWADGHWHDSLFYGLLAPDYYMRKAAKAAE